MDSLHELILACRSADSEKVSERKKQIEKLKLLLNKSHIIRALDKSSEVKISERNKDKMFGWASLFKVVSNIVWREAEALKKAKDAHSTASLKKKQEVCGLLKHVVRQANKNGQWLKGSDVVNHVLNILKDDFTRPLLGMDHMSILLKEILSIRKYWCHLEDKTWHELLAVFVHMLVESPVHLDRVAIARVLHMAIEGASQQCDIRAKKILPNLENYFSKIKQEKSICVQESTLCAVNILCRHIAIDGRIQICRLGENIFIPLLYLWNNRPSDKLKDELVRFYQLQMVAHHPRGAKCVNDGAFAVDWDQWKSNMRQLYGAVYNDLQDLRSRSRFSNSSREKEQNTLKPEMVCLIADLCHQLFTEREAIMEITQASFLSTQIGSAAKKRRVESGWGVLREVLFQHGTTHIAIPWLQLLTALVKKYPKSIPEDEFHPLLSTLQQVLTDSKKSDVTKWLLRCLLVVATAQAIIGKELTSFTVELCDSLWRKIWMSSLRAISLHHAEDEAFCLLSVLLHHCLVNPEKDIWSLFLPNLHKPTETAVQFLMTYLHDRDLPESFIPRNLLVIQENITRDSKKYPLRIQLLEWLLPVRDGDLEEGRTKFTSEKVNVQLLAKTLVALTLRDTHLIEHDFKTLISQGSFHVDCDSNLEPIEDIYLETTFDLPEKASCSNDKGKVEGTPSTIPYLQSELLLALERDTKELLEIIEPEVSNLESMASQACLLAEVMYAMLKHCMITQAEAMKSPLSELLKSLLKKFAPLFYDLIMKDFSTRAHTLLEIIKQLFDSMTGGHGSDHYASSHTHQMAALIRNLVPSKVVEALVALAQDKIRKKKPVSFSSNDTSASSRSFSRKPSNTSVMDDFDLDFDTPTALTETDDFDDLDMNAEESQESSQGSSQGNTRGRQSLFSVELLSEQDQSRLLAVDILCQYCFHTGDNYVVNNNVKVPSISAEYDPNSVSRRLMDLLDADESDWDATKPFDLQLLHHLVRGMCGEHRAVADHEMESLQDALRQPCKLYRRDQEVCHYILEMLSCLASHLGGDEDMVSSSMREARNIALHLQAAYWKYCQEGHYIHTTRMTVATSMEAFVKCDPDCLWAKMVKRGDGTELTKSVKEEYLGLLEDRHHSIRLHVANSVPLVFSKQLKDTYKPLSRDVQFTMFDCIYTQLRGILPVEGRLSPDELKDATSNRTSSLLCALANVARMSAVCERKAIFAICQTTKEHNLDMSLVQKVLTQISTYHGYSSLCVYMTSHMPYLVNQWLESGYNISDFPYKLSGLLNQAEFYRTHLTTVIPFLVMRKDTVSLKSLQQPLGDNWKELVSRAIPNILIHILPMFAASKMGENAGQRDLQKRVAHATSCYDFLIQIVSQEDIEHSIVASMEEIVVLMLMTLDESETDTSNSNGHLLSLYPEPNPPSFNNITISATLDYLTKGHAAQVRSLVALLSKSQDSIQRILLALSVRLSETRRVAEKYRVLHMYQLFVQMLLHEFHDQLGGSWAFVLQDVTYTLLHTLNDMQHDERSMSGSYGQAVMCLGIQLLYNLAQTTVECCSEELCRFLPVIVSTLVPLAELKGEIGNQSVKLIDYLIVECSEVLKTAIRLLDPLPDTTKFTRANQVRQKLIYSRKNITLKQEIRHFLLAAGQSFGSSTLISRKESLEHICQLLSTKKAELVDLVKESEDNALDSDFVQLVYRLIKHSKSTNPQEANVAAKCLGEIGPVHLPVITVKEYPENPCLQAALEIYHGDSKQQQYCWVFHKLSEYLTDPSIDTVVAAGEVLKQILATNTGNAFYKNYKVTVKDHLFQYLHPFKSTKKRVNRSREELSEKEFLTHFDVEELWLPQHDCHEQWIRHLVCTLITTGTIRDEILSLLDPVCKVKTAFGQMLLPFLIHDLLVFGTDVHYRVLTKYFNLFFQRHCQQQKATIDDNDRCISMSKDSVKAMISVVLYLRQQEKPADGRRKPTSWDNNFWLDLDYLPIAQAAHNCDSDFKSLLFSEIWCDVQREKIRQSGGTQTPSDLTGTEGTIDSTALGLTQSSQLETLGGLPNEANINIQNLMLEAYRCVGDPDALYGCGAGRMADTYSRIKTYEHEDSWYKALSSYDLLMTEKNTGNTSTPQVGLLQALQNCGCTHVLDTYLTGLQQDTEGTISIKNLQYEAAWRTSNWDLDTPNRLEGRSSFSEALYNSFVSLRENDLNTVSKSLAIARSEVLNAISPSSLECVRSIYPSMCQLHTVTQTEDVMKLVCGHDWSISKLLDKWKAQDGLLKNDFTFIEPVLSGRCTVFQVLKNNMKHVTQTVELEKGQVLLWEQLANCAREAGRTQVAERAVHKLRQLDCELGGGKAWCWRVEEAWMFWSRGEADTAKHLLKALIAKLEKSQEEDMEAAMLFPKCLGIYGSWLAETRSENPNVIMENYLKKAIDMLETFGTEDDSALDAFLSLARYADSQYQNIVNHMNSATYESKQELIKKAKEDADELKKMGDKSSRYFRILEKQRELDEAELISLQEDRERFLDTALANYLKCLQIGDKHDMRVFRMTSLWFDNSGLEEVNNKLKGFLHKIKSYKFLPLMYQLAARMSQARSHPGDLFQPTLDQLIERTVLDHPHHTLPIILALANANMDQEINQARGGRKSMGRLSKSQTSQDEGEEDRVLAAKAMVNRLKSSHRADIITDMDRLSLAYIEMANWGVEKYKKETRPINIPSALSITQIRNLANVVVPTVETKVDPRGDYKDIVYVLGFDSTFKLAGGINLPKIISCKGSDGVSRRQLVKGKDDLRQDAVMQQVFGMVNDLLHKDSESHRRQLRVRTYKVIPLSQRSGLLEWCEGTIPMGEYLIASQTGAHVKYRPQDIKAAECRTAMNEVHRSGVNTKYAAFLKICKRFKPVFRHFFMENFPDPADWYQRRLAYTRSVATNSIVGYILGLGDRHVQNILIDTRTAEMVHIDLGVAFEQGRILPTPETIPFRLTRDIVDGFGVAGVEGVFRRGCEKTMEVMRGSHEALITILQVLLYDPLYAWTLSPEKAYLLQHLRDLKTEEGGGGDANTTGDILDLEERSKSRTATENVNRVAERVLLRLQQKLQGVEDGVPLSISGQVNLLIQEARDPKNLCRLFPGWQPYI